MMKPNKNLSTNYSIHLGTTQKNLLSKSRQLRQDDPSFATVTASFAAGAQNHTRIKHNILHILNHD